MLIQIRHFLRGSHELKMENYEFELNSRPAGRTEMPVLKC